ncbi:MAG TPA: hypothetical protein DCG57_03455 [Candidatus Riflebacteria bacterium]|nr:hypothetical protein [Candidatus Riflebacteria bacterium]
MKAEKTEKTEKIKSSHEDAKAQREVRLIFQTNLRGLQCHCDGVCAASRSRTKKQSHWPGKSSKNFYLSSLPLQDKLNFLQLLWLC